jgi:hypothetical protein
MTMTALSKRVPHETFILALYDKTLMNCLLDIITTLFETRQKSKAQT